jgi:hypothetical protein
MTPADKAEERLLFSNMNIPPDSPFAEYAGVDNPETSLVGYLGGKDYMDESEDFYNDISKNLLPPKTPDQIAREDLEKQKGLDAFLESQEMKGGRPGGSVPVDVLSQPVTDDTYRMPDVTDASGIFYGDDISPFDPSAIKRPREEFLAEVARQDPLDLPTRSTSLTPLQDIGGRGNVEFAASANPLPVTDSGANPFADAYEAFQDSIKQTKALRDAEKEPPLKQTLMEQEIAEVARQDPFDIPQSDDPSFPDGFTLGTAGGAASNALSFGNLSGLTADSKDGAGKAVFNPDRPTGDPTKPRGGAAPTGVESEILELLKKREEQFDSDKWLALARAGMAMMTSKSSNLLGAIGEGAATGLESLTQSRSAYNDAKLDLLTMRQKLEAARAKGTGPLGPSSTNLTSIYNNLTDENTKLRKDIAAADAINIGTGEPVGNSTLLKQALVKNEMDIDEVKRRLQFKGGVLQTEDVRDGPKTKNKTPSLSEIPELPYALGESVG